MHRPIAFSVTCYPAWLLATLMWWMPAIRSWGLDLPAGPLSGLQSDEFKIREAAQAELLAWARERPEQAMDVLF